MLQVALLLEAHHSQLENVPFSTAVDATLSLVKKPVGSHRSSALQGPDGWIGSWKDSHRKDACCSLGSFSFYSSLSLPYLENSKLTHLGSFQLFVP